MSHTSLAARISTVDVTMKDLEVLKVSEATTQASLALQANASCIVTEYPPGYHTVQHMYVHGGFVLILLRRLLSCGQQLTDMGTFFGSVSHILLARKDRNESGKIRLEKMIDTRGYRRRRPLTKKPPPCLTAALPLLCAVVSGTSCCKSLAMGQEYSTEDEDTSGTGENAVGATVEDVDDVQDLSALSGYRVMKVFQGSPASRSGLAPFEDFVVAVNGAMVDSDNASLAAVLRDNEGKELALVVWNCVDNARRDVALRPVKWNGPGLLGAAVRYEAIAGAADHVQRVLDVLPGSPADDAGLMPNTDYIVGTPAEVFRKEADFSRLVSF